MKDSAVQLPPEMLPFVQERAELWTQYNSTRQQVTQLNELAAKITKADPPGEPIGSPGSINLVPSSKDPEAAPIGEPIGPLSQDKTPPAEIVEVVKQLNQQLAAYKHGEALIDKTKKEITAIKARAQQMTFGIAIAVVVLVLILYFVLT